MLPNAPALNLNAGGGFPAGYPDPNAFTISQGNPTTVQPRSFNMNPAAFNPGAPVGLNAGLPQDTASFSPGGGMNATPQSPSAPPSDVNPDELNALLSQLQMLSNPGASQGGAGLSGLPGMSESKGISGHNSQGTIVAQPDGSYWDVSNGSGGGFLNAIGKVFTFKGILGLGTAALAIWAVRHYIVQRGGASAIQELKPEFQQFDDFLAGFQQHADDLVNAVKSGAKDNVAKLRGKLDELKRILTPYTEDLAGDDAKNTAVNTAISRVRDLHDTAAGVTSTNQNAIAAQIRVKAQKAQEALQQVKTQVVEKD